MTLRVAAIKGYNQADDETTIATMTTPIRFSSLDRICEYSYELIFDSISLEH